MPTIFGRQFKNAQDLISFVFQLKNFGGSKINSNKLYIIITYQSSCFIKFNKRSIIKEFPRIISHYRIRLSA